MKSCWTSITRRVIHLSALHRGFSANTAARPYRRNTGSSTLSRLLCPDPHLSEKPGESESSMLRGWGLCSILCMRGHPGMPTVFTSPCGSAKLQSCQLCHPHKSLHLGERKVTLLSEVSYLAFRPALPQAFPHKKNMTLCRHKICHFWNNYLHLFACLSCTEHARWDWLQ